VAIYVYIAQLETEDHDSERWSRIHGFARLDNESLRKCGKHAGYGCASVVHACTHVPVCGVCTATKACGARRSSTDLGEMLDRFKSEAPEISLGLTGRPAPGVSAPWMKVGTSALTTDNDHGLI